MKQIVGGKYPNPSQFRPSLPLGLERLAMRALAADPDARFQNAREFSEALDEAAPRASSRRVSEWVNDLAKPVLTERAHMIAQVENWEGAAPLPAKSAPFAADGLIIKVPQALTTTRQRRDSRPGAVKPAASPSQRPPASSRPRPQIRARLLALISATLLIIATYYVLYH
jgi:hypothetical protein